MKSRFRIPLIAAAILAALPVAAVAAPSSPAQLSPNSSAADQKKPKLAEYLAQLNLTPQQQAQITPIQVSEKQQVKAVRHNTTLTPEQVKSQIGAIHKSSRQQILAILTLPQRKQLKQLQKAWKLAHPQQVVAPPPPAG